MPFTSKKPDISIPADISITNFIAQNLHGNPNHQLLVDPYGAESFTNRQALNIINQVSAGFYRKGVHLGEVVAICLPTITVYPLIVTGIQNIGAIATTVNPMLTAKEIAHLLEDSSAQYLITIPQHMDKVKEVRQRLASLKEIIVLGEAIGATPFRDLINNDGEFPIVEFDPITTVALIQYSSGTTGLPKGVEVTHYNIIANVLQCLAAQIGMDREHETLVSFLPFYHTYGMKTMYQAFRSCHTSIIMPKFDAASYLKIIQEYKVTKLFLVPPVFIRLAKEPTFSQYDTSSVRVISCGAAPLGPGVEEALKVRLPQAIVAQGYGMTELTCTSHTVDVSAIVQGSVGQLVPNMTIKIVELATGKELGLGQPGEVWLKGPNVMKGYLNNPKATAEMIDKEGFLHTGDIGYMDEELNLFIVDRLKELIKYKGLQVAPAELEALLLNHPDIYDVAVIGKPDIEAGELPLAFVVRKTGSRVTAKEIVAWAEKETAPHKKLRGGVVFVDSIPKSPSGKILRKILRAKL